MKDRWCRHYEGKKKGSHFYSGEACMKQKQFRKPTLYDHKYLQIWQINPTKVYILLFKTNAQNKNVKYTPSKMR